VAIAPGHVQEVALAHALHGVGASRRGPPEAPTADARQKGHRFMDALLFLVVVSLFIIAGVVSSVRLYTRGALGTGRLPSDPVMEEIIEEEAPVEELV